MKPMSFKRLQLMIRCYLREPLRRSQPPHDDDPLWELVGLVKGNRDDSVSVDEVVYGPRRSA
jgi:hypothetical protein